MTAESFSAADAWRLGAGDQLRVGISACLLGREVRYDGGHKRQPVLVETLGRFVEWVPVCPEVEAGFGTPREAMQLVRIGGNLRLVTVDTRRDMTARLEQAVATRLQDLASRDLSGYILKKNSPSCGWMGVNVFDEQETASPSGRGLFASALSARFPHLPVEEEDRLSDPAIRENFVERVIGYRRLRVLFDARWDVADLMRFHSAHKLMLMAHAPQSCTALGRVAAAAREQGRAETEREYSTGFMQTLATVATPGRHTNVLQHMAGYFSQDLDQASRDRLHATIGDYHSGRVPLSVPLAAIREHVRARNIAYLADQLYLFDDFRGL